MTSPFDSPTRFCIGCPLKFFLLGPTVQKLFVCIYFAGNLASRFQHLGFSGGFDSDMWPRNVISYQRDPRKAPPCSKPRRLSDRACKSVKPFLLWSLTRKQGKVRHSKKSFWGYISPICGAASSQPILSILGTSRNLADVINRAKFYLDR
jgi:hypothetical protein